MRITNLRTGDLFVMNGALFIKTNERENNCIRVVKLEGYNKGHILCVAPDAKVKGVDTNGYSSTDINYNNGTGRRSGHKF